MLGGEAQRFAVGRCEQIRFTVCSTSPDRADRVYHPASRQPIPTGDLRVTGLAPPERATLGEQLRTGRPMNRTVDAAAAKERRICGVHDRVDGERSDVGL